MKSIEITISLLILTIVIILSIYAYISPLRSSIENYLSIYPFPRLFPWYPAWRIAVIFFLAWITVLFLYLMDIVFLKYVLLILGIIFSLAHYISLSKYNVAIYPFFFLVINEYGCDLHLDIGQIILILSLIPFIKSYWRRRIEKKN